MTAASRLVQPRLSQTEWALATSVGAMMRPFCVI